MNNTNQGAEVVIPPTDGQERLVVVDREHLHSLGRFFRAMILNFLKAPGKVHAIERLNLTVAFDPPGHPENGLTVTFKRGRVILEGTIRGKPDLTIVGETPVLMKLSRLPYGLAMIKFLRTPEGKDLIAGMRSGDLKIKGAIKHPLGIISFSKFMAPNVN